MGRRKEPKATKRTTAKKVQALEGLPPPPVVPDVEVHPEPDDEPWGADGLNTRQRLFVDALLGPAAGVATKAAEIAGYSADNRKALRVTAYRLLTYANVQHAIARAYAKLREGPEWAKAALVDLAFATFGNFITLDANDEPVIDWAKAAEAGALGQIREYREEGIAAGGTTSIIKRTIKLHDRSAALSTLLKMHGLLKDHVEHSGEVSHLHATQAAMGRIIGDPEALAAARQLAARAAALKHDTGGTGDN